ncbi:hypothetical protein [Agrobacterium tumefaciens]|uniref:hypothetical protein n=1 Tax=Agrobacterium tumefaciens TaxID=358 RepID=UPI0022434E75|nr:hypothetical protein [Agrobacterium tumefaciens]MCW8059146.1 hypothetical protein [Agrobacterium tumefaciens]MCW8143388.1 hypothetical protein [Agrobacterium tumefaciens]
MTQLSSREKKLLVMRCISAFALFAIFGMANNNLSEINNSILAFGRSAIILVPIALAIFGAASMGVSFIAMTIGTLLIFLDLGELSDAVAAGSFAYGTATSGYLMRSVASTTKIGSAKNRVALNVGSSIAGCALMLPVSAYNYAILVVLILSIGMTIIELSRPSLTEEDIRKNSKILFKPSIAWILCGISIGVLNFGLFSVLPQFLILNTGKIPLWYGFMVIINSLTIVLIQVKFVKLVDKYINNTKLFTVAIIFLGFVVMAFPSLFLAQYFLGALIWVVLITISECGFSYLDYYAYQDDMMLTKELSVGLGAAITVYISRACEYPISFILVGLVGALTILGYFILSELKLRRRRVA